MTYLGNPVTQLDSSAFARQNCVLASTDEVGDCSSLGYWRIPPSRLRTITGDTSGGVTYSQARDAISKATNGEVALTVLYWAPQDATTSTLDNLLNAPRVTCISIDCSVTVNTPYATGNFTGGHTVVLGAKRYATITRSDGSKYTQKQGYIMDPGHSTAKWVWWPWSLILKATAARAGAGKVHVLYSRDLGNVSRKVLADTHIFTTKYTTSPTVGILRAGTYVTVIETVRGGEWTVDTNHTANGWSRIGTGKFVIGGKLR